MNKKGNVFVPAVKKKGASIKSSDMDLLKFKHLNEEFMKKVETVVEPLLTKYDHLTSNKLKLEPNDFKMIASSIMIIQTYAKMEVTLSKDLKQRDLLDDLNLALRELRDMTEKYNKLNQNDPHIALRDLHFECDRLLNDLARLEKDLIKDAAQLN
jgi:hypothetical protein